MLAQFHRNAYLSKCGWKGGDVYALIPVGEFVSCRRAIDRGRHENANLSEMSMEGTIDADTNERKLSSLVSFRGTRRMMILIRCDDVDCNANGCVQTQRRAPGFG